MLGTAVAILLCLLPSQVNTLTALATCLSGNQWMFSSIGQSPCDVAVELASVCYSTTYQVSPLRPASGNLYQGPYKGYDTSCLCNSVYYSLLSACSYCQGGSILPWSNYTSNCTSVSLAVYPQLIPLEVKVPAYAYQNVSLDNRFNVSLASTVKGESSRTLPIPTSSPSTADVIASKPGSPRTVGGVVGGLLGIGLLAGLISFLVLRSKQKSQSQNHDKTFQQSPNTEIGLDITGPLKSPSDLNAPQNQTPQFTGNGRILNDASPQPIQQTTGVARGYSGMPEL